MPYNGSGGFSYPANSFNPAIGGTTISSADNNSILSDAETAFSMVQTVDGQSTITSNLPMSGFKHTGVNTNSGSTSRSEYASGATAQDNVIQDAGVTAGSSTVYTATLSPAITAYVDKACYRVQFDEACGSSPTINFNTVGAKKIYKNVGGVATQLSANDVPANFIGILRYDTALDAAAGGFWLVNTAEFNISALTETTTVDYYNDKLPIYDNSATANRNVRPEYLLGLMAGYIFGLALSNNGSDTNNDIDIAIGRATDNTAFALMELTGALTKRLDANWAVGTNQGGLDTGSKASSTLYYVWLIQRPDTGVVDVLFSTSATSPTMPANYTIKRVIGAIFTDGSSNIRQFYQQGRWFYYKTRVLDANATAMSNNTPITITATVPPNATGLYSATMISDNPFALAFYASAQNQPTNAVGDYDLEYTSIPYDNTTRVTVTTDASRQFKSVIFVAGGAVCALSLRTIGWTLD